MFPTLFLTDYEGNQESQFIILLEISIEKKAANNFLFWAIALQQASRSDCVSSVIFIRQYNPHKQSAELAYVAAGRGQKVTVTLFVLVNFITFFVIIPRGIIITLPCTSCNNF